jgi:hypothetical protein
VSAATISEIAVQKQLVTLFSRFHLRQAKIAGQPVGEKTAAILNMEVAGLGYSLEQGLFGQLAALPARQFDSARTEMLGLLGDISGATARHRTLFAKFPYEKPEDLAFLANWVLAAVGRQFAISTNRLRLDRHGNIIDIELSMSEEPTDGDERVSYAFNSELSGDGLSEHQEVRHAYVQQLPLKMLYASDRGFVKEAAATLLARPSSLSADERTFLDEAATMFSLSELMAPLLASGRKPFRETLPYIYGLSKDMDTFAPLVAGASDVLRIAAYVSDPEADLSLKKAVRFKLSGHHKRNMLQLLEDCPNLGEDLLRHRERWLRFGERVNPGTAENRRRHPKVAAAFDALRNAPSSIPTFNRTVEQGLRSGTIDRSLLDTLAARPGEFLRRLDVLLRTGDDTATVVDRLSRVAKDAPSAILFAVAKHLQSRMELRGTTRAFFPKGNVNRMQVVEDRRLPLTASAAYDARRVISEELQARFRSMPGMGRVYLDPGLHDIVVPFNRRGDSSTDVAMSKGSRYPFQAPEVARLFVHWTGEDVDLSMLCLDEQLETVAHVSWTNLEEYRCVHSGDVRSAPSGANEFIDFEPADLRERGVRYVLASVISYSGATFDTFPCFAGVMARDGLKSGRKFEAGSVTLKFDMNAETRAMMPLLFDLDEMKLIYADIASGGGNHATVTGSADKLKAQARAVLDLVHTKPTAWDVLFEHAAARGELVDSIEQADMVFTAVGLDLEKLMEMTAVPPCIRHGEGSAENAPPSPGSSQNVAHSR